MYKQTEIDRYQITAVKGDKRTVAWPDKGTEEKALAWFASLDPAAQLAQIKFMYQDRMVRNEQAYQAASGG